MNIHETVTNKQMMHSTSVNALSKSSAAQGLIQHELQTRPTPLSNQNSRFNAHSQASQQSLSTSNLNAISSGNKLSFGSSNRQGATNGVKLIPSSQISSWVNGHRAESPSVSTSNGSSNLLAHHQTQASYNIEQNPLPSSFRQQSKGRHQSGTIGGGDGGVNSGVASHAKTTSNGFFTGVQSSSSSILHTISHKEQRQQSGTNQQLKQTKSFNSSGEASSNLMSGNSKPPSNSKNNLSSHQTRTIDQTSSSHKGGHHQAGNSITRSSEHQSLSHMRTQASLGLKTHLTTNFAGNQRQSSQNNDNAASMNKSSSVGQKRGTEATDQEKHLQTKSSFAKQNRLDSKQSANSSQTTGQRSLIGHKTPLNDYKKPVSVAQNPVTSQSVKNSQVASSSTPSSHIVSAHSYQQPISNQGNQNSTINSMHQKSGNYSQIQTPSGSLKSQKPPIGNDSIKHAHSSSLHGSLTMATAVSSSIQITTSQTIVSKLKRSSPRSQLNVFTKKSSTDSGKAASILTKHSLTTVSQQHLGTFSPKLSESESDSKRCSDTNKSQQQMQISSNTYVSAASGSKSNISSQQQQTAQSLKTQVTQQAKNGENSQKLTNQQTSLAYEELRSRNALNKGGNTNKVGLSQVEIEKIVAPDADIDEYVSRGQAKKHTYPLTTKNNVNSFNGRSSSVSMNSSSQATFQVAKETSQHNHGKTQTHATLDRFKDKHPKLHQDSSSIGQQTEAKATIPLLNAYRQRSASPPDPIISNISNPSGLSKYQLAPQSTSTIQPGSKGQTLAAQMSHKLAQNRAPQLNNTIAQQSQQTQQQPPKTASEKDKLLEEKPSQISSHSQKMIAHNANNFQRKVRSATRASDIQQETESGQQKLGAPIAMSQQSLNLHSQHKLSKQKITDRPSSASAGQKFIGKQQNLKELFERNWKSVNVQHKVDPQSGEATQIRTLTVVDTNCMVHEEQEQAAALPLAPGTRIIIPNHEPTKCSNKRNGIVRAYAANTNQGLVRNYNEDRVSIILNIVKPEHRKHETWPTCSFFGVYDGHGGSACAEFLRDNLHHYVIKEESFPWEPEQALRGGFAKAEARFLEMCQAKDEVTGQLTVIERSGSCAIVVLIVGDICFVSNVGDSRAVLSSGGGQHMTALSRDHKPSDVEEYKRIIQAGGQIYQTTTTHILNQREIAASQKQGQSDPEYIVGPIRVLPGRLSVCRTFGDPEAKLEYRGGNPNVVQAVPDIRKFQISKQHDFIVLASDGIFDKLSDEDIGKAVWITCETAKQAKSTISAGQVPPQQSKQIENNISVHQYCGLGVEGILKNSLMRQSLDNVTVVMVGFQNFKRIVCDSQTRIGSEEKPTDAHAQKKISPSKGHSGHRQQEQSQTTQPGVGLEKENISFINNSKKTQAARSQQHILPYHGDRPDFQDRNLTRQDGDKLLTAGHENHSDLGKGGSRLQGNGLPRTRSQNHYNEQEQAGATQQSRTSTLQQQQQQESFSIRQQQQQQATKMSYGSSNSFARPRPSEDQQQNHQSKTNLDNSRQQAKPPMAANNQASKQTKTSLQRDNSSYPNQGVRSLSLKEVNQVQHQTSNNGTQDSQHGRFNNLANLNSNKSLGGVSSHYNGTPTTQSSLKSNSLTIQPPQQADSAYKPAGGGSSHQDLTLVSSIQSNQQQQLNNYAQQKNHSKPSPSQINHHRHSQQHPPSSASHTSSANNIIFGKSQA